MKNLKKVIRLCALVLFILLALAGIGILGVAPVLNKDRKLFADTEWVDEHKEKTKKENIGQENFKL